MATTAEGEAAATTPSSPRTAAAAAAERTMPPPPSCIRQPQSKRCDGACGMTKPEDGYSISMWSRGPRRKRMCLVCSRLPPPSHPPPPSSIGTTMMTATATVDSCSGGRKRRASSSTATTFAGGVDDARLASAPPPRSRRRHGVADGDPPRAAAVAAAVAVDDDVHPPPNARRPGNDDDVPPRVRAVAAVARGGRIRPCMCRRPSECRELLRRWARLGDRQRVGHVRLPSRRSGGSRPDTKAGRHVDAFRRVAHRVLGSRDGGEGGEEEEHDDDAAEDGPRRRRKKCERIAMVHFHPSVVPYLLRDAEGGSAAGGGGGGGARRIKSDRWRVPLEVGNAIGYSTGVDGCPDPDSNDVITYFAVPNYGHESALADVERAEEEFDNRMRAIRAEDEILMREATADPGKFVVRMHDLRRAHALSTSENAELRERLRWEETTRSAMAAKASRLQRGIERMARRLERLEKIVKGNSTSGGRRSNRNSAGEIYKDATGRSLVIEEEINGGEEGPPDTENRDRCPGAVKDGRGGRRWSDSRMDRAVEAKWRNPALSAEEALRMGGYVFPPSSDDADGKKSVVDSDNVSIAQRKNNLLRRLRLRRNAVAVREDSGRDVGMHLEEDDEAREKG